MKTRPWVNVVTVGSSGSTDFYNTKFYSRTCAVAIYNLITKFYNISRVFLVECEVFGGNGFIGLLWACGMAFDPIGCFQFRFDFAVNYLLEIDFHILMFLSPIIKKLY